MIGIATAGFFIYSKP